jgi:hypothetical protein
MDARLAELEAALAANWDREHLAVYGDYLQSIGDPRGELIAIDLDGRDHGERKHELIERWLRADVVPLLRLVGTVEYGFLTVHATYEHSGSAIGLLQSAVGGYLRRLVIGTTSSVSIEEIVHVTRSTPRPWLREIDLSSCESGAFVFSKLADLPWRDQITTYRLPSIRDQVALAELERSLQFLRPDAEIIVARAYRDFQPKQTPSPRIRVPDPFPWPPPDIIVARRVEVRATGRVVGSMWVHCLLCTGRR